MSTGERVLLDHWRQVGFEDDYLSISRVERASLAAHPWSLGGGGASELKELLEERAESRLSDVIDDVGFSIIVGEDELFMRPSGRPQWKHLPRIPIVIGEEIRDWSIAPGEDLLSPFTLDTYEVDEASPLTRELWPWRTILKNRVVSGSTTMEQAKKPWFDVRRLSRDKHKTPLTIAFGEVATHNHFVLDRGRKVFNRTAPIIKLPAAATEDDHLALVAYLNSSTACFWMKQVCFDKGNRGEGGGFTSEEWEKFYQFNGSNLADLPLPAMTAHQRAAAAALAADLSALAADASQAATRLVTTFEVSTTIHDLQDRIEAVGHDYDAAVDGLRAKQEHLDWWVYGLFGLASAELAVHATTIRASDVLFARQVLAGVPGRRYFELCRLPPPEQVAVASTFEPHLTAIAGSDALAMIESPKYKRTFREGFRPLEPSAVARGVIVAAVERHLSGSPSSMALRELAAGAAGSQPLATTLAWLGAEGPDVVAALLRDNAVPYLAALRFTESGLGKHEEWQTCWSAQRAEDVDPESPTPAVPPRYSQADCTSGTYFRLRGKLDVPKERFISYPGCESDEDGEPVYGWAGWDHLQRAQALAALYMKRKDGEGWAKDRLTPMLAGLLELVPWVKQWHNEPRDEYGGLRMGDYFEQFLDGECRQHGLSHADLRAWRPTKKSARKSAKPTAPNDLDETAEPPASAAATPAKKPRKPRTKKPASAEDDPS